VTQIEDRTIRSVRLQRLDRPAPDEARPDAAD
jgi:hypothetical protein